jgi:hypothetical protein
MAKNKISEFDVNPDNNTDINNINIAEGCAPSGINNAIRQLMSDLKEFQTGGAGDPFNGAVNGTVGATTPASGAFTSLSASGAFSANGGATLGDASGDALTINSSAVSIPNGLNFDSNTFVIDASNNRVGVNIVTPTVALDVYSPADAIMFNVRENTSGNARRIRFSNAGAVNTIESTAGIGTTNLAFTIDGNEAMRINTSGNVGIGTSSPSSGARLTLTGSSTNAAVLRLFNNAQTSNGFEMGQGFDTGSDNIGYFYNRANAAIVFGTNSTERIRIPSNAGGIQFPATQVASSDANTLDDYEEGTWTPVIKFGTTTATADVSGFYTKVGRLVTVTGYINLQSKNGGTGVIGMEGFPFAVITSAAQGSRGGAAVGYFTGFSSVYPHLMLGNNSTIGTFRKGNGTDFNNTEVVDGSSCWFSYTYISN